MLLLTKPVSNQLVVKAAALKKSFINLVKNNRYHLLCFTFSKTKAAFTLA